MMRKALNLFLLISTIIFCSNCVNSNYLTKDSNKKNSKYNIQNNEYENYINYDYNYSKKLEYYEKEMINYKKNYKENIKIYNETLKDNQIKNENGKKIANLIQKYPAQDKKFNNVKLNSFSAFEYFCNNEFKKFALNNSNDVNFDLEMSKLAGYNFQKKHILIESNPGFLRPDGLLSGSCNVIYSNNTMSHTRIFKIEPEVIIRNGQKIYSAILYGDNQDRIELTKTAQELQNNSNTNNIEKPIEPKKPIYEKPPFVEKPEEPILKYKKRIITPIGETLYVPMYVLSIPLLIIVDIPYVIFSGEQEGPIQKHYFNFIDLRLRGK